MRKFFRPSYCEQPAVDNCLRCSMANGGRDCHNAPIPEEMGTFAVMEFVDYAAEEACLESHWHLTTAIDIMAKRFSIDREQAEEVLLEHFDRVAWKKEI